MTEPNSQAEKSKEERRSSQEQFDMLKRCSDKKDMTEWNEWRRSHPDKDVLLEDADFSQLYLKGVLLNAGGSKNDETGEFIEFSGKVHLEGAIFERAHLEHAELLGAHLNNAILYKACLREADLRLAILKDAILWESCFEGANLNNAHLERGKLDQIHLEKAGLEEAHLEGAVLYEAYLEGASLQMAIVDGSTLIWDCNVDRQTDFRGVGLGSCRIDSGTKQLLQYNTRRMNWEDWYKEHYLVRWLVKPFWWISDYGISTAKIVATFFILAFLFANIYYHLGRIAPPGIVDNLFVDNNGFAVQWWLVPLRALYFSVVTMTTLGFGDMYANAHSIWGHILLSIQVILGYVLLGALVTRFAVLFTGGGPAGKFADDKNDKATEGTE